MGAVKKKMLNLTQGGGKHEKETNHKVSAHPAGTSWAPHVQVSPFPKEALTKLPSPAVDLAGSPQALPAVGTLKIYIKQKKRRTNPAGANLAQFPWTRADCRRDGGPVFCIAAFRCG